MDRARARSVVHSHKEPPMKLVAVALFALGLSACVDDPSGPTSSVESEIGSNAAWYCPSAAPECVLISISVPGAHSQCVSRCPGACVIATDNDDPCDFP